MTSSRKGARTVASVDPKILEALETGRIETANLTEGLAIRMDRLFAAVAADAPQNAIDMTAGVVVRMAHAGAALRHLKSSRLESLASHTSDTVRGWVAFAIGQDLTISPQKRIDAMRPFAADLHFAVREWAWMAVRALIVADPLATITQLARWTSDTDANIQRFTSEATRPRGVWAASIPLLRKTPDYGLQILTPLRHTPHRYVEDSVANWLNDAAKDNEDWVRSLLQQWVAAHASPRLINRAGRSLKSV
jgi:3-methyladenine DNA glycosylase AlkC